MSSAKLKEFWKLSKAHWLFLLVLACGLFLRAYKPYEWFMYNHDQDLASWIIKDIVKDGHLRLIGQETSSKGIFIGPLFYYLQIPFYILFGWDPKGAVWLPVLISFFSIFSLYYVFSKIVTKQVGLIAVVIYACSYLITFIEREVAPTMPVMLWTIWALYALWLLLKGKQKAYVLIGFLWGLVWNLNLALIILSPLILLAQIYSKAKFNFKYLLLGIGIFVVIASPFFIFEIKHNYQQINALKASLTTQKDYTQGTSTGVAKLDRVMQLVHKNTRNMFLDSVLDIPIAYVFYSLVAMFVYLVIKRLISFKLASILLLWQVLYLAFFTSNSINISEYYLNGMNIVWLLIFAIFLSFVFNKQKVLGAVVLVFVVGLNLIAFTRYAPNDSGYVYRSAIVDFITSDAKTHGYPCVAVSYITTPGNNLGYRYLFYLNKLHVNQPKSGSPVYSIVFPHSMVDKIDKSFGALGLILPDYGKYTEEQIKESCSGANANLTDPFFGFTN